ncbi:MAG TPA: S8 family serine peptidase [Candidatus Dormibacteraeota bacterium]|nr:S8 family serine peptidase [Candidatus Dormibacteraeota bacterium]
MGRGPRGRRLACAGAAACAALWGGGLSASAFAGGPTSAPDDPAFRAHEQWGLAQAGFPSAWCRSTGAGALIVVIDTGIWAGHPDLAGKVAGEAAVHDGAITTGPAAALDDSGHGTHVAGIAAAATGNATGIAGAAPDARVFAIKVLWPSGGSEEQGTRSDLVQAIDYATTAVAPAWPGPVVLNVSIGAADAPGSSSDALSGADGDVDGAIERAAAAGLGVALAAGNTGTTGIGGAAVAQGAALSVGALAADGSVAPYSPTSGVSIFAPGGSAGGDGRYTGTGILSTWLDSSSGEYAWMAGTSMAAPHVAAALALLMSGGLSNRDADARLLSTADSTRRMHVDAAVGSTGPCGLPAAAPASTGRRGVPVVAPVPAAQTQVRAVVVAPPPVASPWPSPVAVLPATGAPRVTPAAAHVSGGGHPLLRSAVLALAATVLLWLLLPRRLLRRRDRVKP